VCGKTLLGFLESTAAGPFFYVGSHTFIARAMRRLWLFRVVRQLNLFDVFGHDASPSLHDENL